MTIRWWYNSSMGAIEDITFEETSETLPPEEPIKNPKHAPLISVKERIAQWRIARERFEASIGEQWDCDAVNMVLNSTSAHLPLHVSQQSYHVLYTKHLSVKHVRWKALLPVN